jgi:hypothetical protein
MKAKGKQKRTLTKLQMQIRKKRFKQWTMALSAVVVFCVTYALILPAITISSATYCKQEEHTHSTECYLSKTPLCGLEEEEAIEGHSHDDSCYETNEEGEKVLVCTQLETASTAGHTHSESCYSSADPICGLEEHTHTRQCYSNPEAVEDESDWKASVPEKLDDDLSKAIIQVAKSQKDYKESEDNFEVQDDESEKGYTRYGNWADDSYGDWNNYFTGFVLKYAGVDLDDLFYNKVISTWNSNTQSIQKTNLEDLSEGNIVFYLDEESNALSTGIVNEIDEKNEKVEIYTGDQGDKVDLIKIKNESITGYLQAKEKEETSNNSQEETTEQQASQEAASQPEENSEAEETTDNDSTISQATSENLEEEKTLIYKDERMQIIVNYSDDANIPENAKLQVESSSTEKDTFDSDISIVCDGKEIEPDVPVSVSIKFLDGSFEDQETLSLIHYLYKEEVYETIDATRSSDEDGNAVFSFTAFSFSIFKVGSINLISESNDTTESNDTSDTSKKIVVYLDYKEENGQTVYPTQKLTFGAKGNVLGYVHTLPTLTGYEAIDDEENTITTFEVPLDAQDGQHYTIIYVPAAVNYWIAYYQECIPDEVPDEEGFKKTVTDNDHDFAEYVNSHDKIYKYFESVQSTGRTEKTIQLTTDDIKSYEGMSYQEVQTDKVKIAAEGNTVLNLFYNRNTYQVSVRWTETNVNNSNESTNVINEYTYVYGQKFTEPNVTRNGYTLEGWFYDKEFTEKVTFGDSIEKVSKIKPDSELGVDEYNNIYPKWVAGDTTYTIKVWAKNPNAKVTDESSPQYYNYVTSYTNIEGKTGTTITSSAVAAKVAEKLKTDFENEYDYYQLSSKTDSVVLAGDNTSSLNIYYVPKTYSLRFYYAMKTESGNTTKYYIPSSNTPGYQSTDGISTEKTSSRFQSDKCSWSKGNMYSDDLECLYKGVCWYQINSITDPSSLLNFTDSSNKGRGSVETTTVLPGTTITYYYIYITAEYGQDIYSIWPSKSINSAAYNSTNYSFMSWGVRNTSPYLSTYKNTNINGIYGEMDNIMVTNSATIAGADGANPTQSFVAYWSVSAATDSKDGKFEDNGNRTNYILTYKIYFTSLSSELANENIEKVTYEGTGLTYTLQDTVYSMDTDPMDKVDDNGNKHLTIPNFSDVDPSSVAYKVLPITDYYGNELAENESPQPKNTYRQTVNIYYTRASMTVTILNKEGSKIKVNVPYGEYLDTYSVSSYIDDSKNTVVTLDEPILLKNLAPLPLTGENKTQYELDTDPLVWGYDDASTASSDYDASYPFSFDNYITRNISLVCRYHEKSLAVKLYLSRDDAEPKYTTSTTYKKGLSSDDITKLDDLVAKQSESLGDFLYWQDEDGNTVNFDRKTFNADETKIYAVFSRSNSCHLTINYYLETNGKKELYFSTFETHDPGTTKTVEAIRADEFEEKGYENKPYYYPEELSTTVTFIETDPYYSKEEKKYIVDLIYKYVKPIKYTIRYVLMEPDVNGKYVEAENIIDPVVIETENGECYVTATYKQIKGYGSYDFQYQKSLQLTSNPDKNIITFRYIKGNTSQILVNCWKQNIYEGYTLADSISVDVLTNYQFELFQPEPIDGYTLNTSKTTVLKGINVSDAEKAETITSDDSTVKYIVPENGVTVNFYYDGIPIVIEKTWLGGTTPETLTFTLYKAEKNNLSSREIVYDPIQMSSSDPGNSASNSKWTKTIHVPDLSSTPNSEYALIESTGGYIVSISGDDISKGVIDNKPAAVFDGTEEITVQISNKQAKALPSTGGAGRNSLTYTGAILVGTAFVMYEYDKRKKRERRHK